MLPTECLKTFSFFGFFVFMYVFISFFGKENVSLAENFLETYLSFDKKVETELDQ